MSKLNFTPLLKIVGIVVIAFILLTISKTIFQDPYTEQLNRIPSNADAVVVVHPKEFAQSLFYQRVYNEEEFRKQVNVNDELERELLNDAIKAGIDVLSPIALFSLPGENTLIGIVCRASGEDGLMSFIDKYFAKLEIDGSFSISIENGNALVLFDSQRTEEGLSSMIKSFDAYTEEKLWLKELASSEHDLIAYINSEKSSNSILYQYLAEFTPHFVAHSITYLDMNDDKLSISHKAKLKDKSSKFIKPASKGFTTSSGAMVGNLSLNMYDSDTRSYFRSISPVLKTDSGEYTLHLDSLLRGDIAVRINGAGFSGLNVSGDGEVYLSINSDYWSRVKQDLLACNYLKTDGDVLYALVGVKVFIDDRTKGELILSQRKTNFSNVPQWMEQGVSPKIVFKVSDLLERIELPVLSEDFEEFKEFDMHVDKLDGSIVEASGHLVFHKDNHSVIDILHVLTNYKSYLEPMEAMIQMLTSMR